MVEAATSHKCGYMGNCQKLYDSTAGVSDTGLSDKDQW